MKIGYACINMTLQTAGGITTNRGMRQKTFNERGLPYVSELALQNAKDLVNIIKWNNEMGIKLFRMSSDIFPWFYYYQLDELPDYEEISDYLYMAGDEASIGKQRLTFHPSHFNALGSPNPVVIKKTIKELNQHAEIMDLMGLPKSHLYPINIHCNGVYGDKNAAMSRWASNYLKLSESAQKRLVVENDDKASMYSVKDLYNGIFSAVKVPITFDFHHHRFNTGDLTEEEAFILAKHTWDYHNVRPLFHYSSCRRTFEDPHCKAQAHADFIYERINTYGYVEIERIRTPHQMPVI